MTTNIATFQTQVEILLGPSITAAQTELRETDIPALIRAAVERYSKDRPDHVTEDEAGDDGRYYLVTGLASWVEDFSRVLAIQYPAEAVSEDNAPQYLSDDDWRDDYWVGTNRYIFLPNHAPATGETMRITYTAPYVWTAADATTTPTSDFYAICHLAAGLCCQAIATKYSRTSDSTITADSVRQSTRAYEFSKRAKEYISYYENHLGIGSTQDGKPAFVRAAGTFIDFDTMPYNQDHLYHHRGTR